MKENFYLSETDFGQKLIKFFIDFLGKNEKLFLKFPTIASLTVTAFWILGATVRHTLYWPLITGIEFIVCSILFAILTAGQQFLKWRFFNYTILVLTLSQAMIMGLNKSLILVGILFTLLSTGHFLGMFYHQVLTGLKNLITHPTIIDFTPIKSKFQTTIIFILLSAFAFILFALSYTSPGLDSNQQVYVGASYLSSFHDGFIDRFTKVWEIKPVFHRIYVFMYYKLATIQNDFLDKKEFESSVYFFYGLITSLMITFGVLAGRKKLCNFSKLPLWAIIILGISMQGVMAIKLFEAEEMTYSFSVLGIGLLLSGFPLLVFFSPFIFLYITLLKGVTLLIPASLIIFSLLLFKFKKSDYIAFISGSIVSVILLALFFIKYPVFVQEYGDAGTLQQSTVLFSSIIRLITSLGAIGKGLFYNTYIIIGVISGLILFCHFKDTKNYRFFSALLILWTGTTLIPIVLGKGFTYYALPMAIASFLTILIFTREYSQIDIKDILSKKHLNKLVAGLITSIALLAASELWKYLFIFLIPVIIIISLLYLYKNNKLNVFTPILILLLVTFSANSMWSLAHKPWKAREASYLGDYNELMEYIQKNADYKNNEMMYLTYGREVYYLGLRTPNRYFYTLVMRRHMHMVDLIETNNKYLKVFKRIAPQLRDMILRTNIMKKTLEETANYDGKYILNSNTGWCNLELYPEINNKIKTEYKLVLETKKHKLYERIEL